MIMKITTGVLILSVLVLLCTKLPTQQTVSDSNSIKISLEVQGRHEAVFSGEPILAIIETTDTISFNSIAWHLGRGSYSIPDNMVGKIGNYFEVNLYWKAYPVKRDSIDKLCYDSIYVTIGGNLQKSNVVKIKVINLPVIFDSLKVNNTVFTGPDTVWKYSSVDTAKKLSISLFALDLDMNSVQVTYNEKLNGLKQLQNPVNFTYSVPAGDYHDTLIFRAYDPSGGQVIRTLILSNANSNNPPVFNSIAFDDTMLKGSDSVYTLKIDTARSYPIHLYLSDPDRDSLTVLWIVKNDSSLDLLTETSAIYTALNSRSIDTLVIKVSDGILTAKKKLILKYNNLALIYHGMKVNQNEIKIAGGDCKNIFVCLTAPEDNCKLFRDRFCLHRLSYVDTISLWPALCFDNASLLNSKVFGSRTD